MTRFSEDEIRTMIRLRGEGKSFRGIARTMGRSDSGIRAAWRKHVNATGEAIPETTDMPGPPSTKQVDVLVDARELDGNTTIVKKGKQLIKPSEFKEMLGFGNEWIATHHSSNTWQSPMKLRTQVDGKLVETPYVQDLWQSSTKWRRVIGEEMQEAIKEWVRNNVTPIKCPPTLPSGTYFADETFMLSWGLWDLHVGMYAFSKEVGRDYDVQIAVNRALNSVDDMINELRHYKIVKIQMPIGNDFMHFDNVRQRTTAAQHDQDADSRWPRALRAAVHILTYMVQRALEICDNVDVFWVPGNHDTYTSYQLTTFLWGRFHGDNRVTVDLNEDPQKIRRHGGVAIIYEHGQGVPAGRWPLIFHERVLEHAEKHGLSTKLTYKEVQVGHTHQKKAKDFMAETPQGGVRVIVNPTLCNTDFWHHQKGFIGAPTKSVEAYRYDEIGVRGSHIVWARDEERKI